MQLLRNEPLAKYTTMNIGGPANFLSDAENKIELQNTIRWAQSHNMPILTIGGGSNTIFTDEGFNGMVIINKIPGFETLENDDEHAVVRVGAGENWDKTVEKTTQMGLSGIEALSLIPGTAGAAPVQNIGAYGQELADTFVELEAYDFNTSTYTTLSKEACGFGYRTSIFKNAKPRRYVIASITLRLSKQWMTPPLYQSLQDYVSERGVDELSPANIRSAVIDIRNSKLPSPKELPNSGSFFKSAVVPMDKFKQIREKFAGAPGYDLGDGSVKIPAGWLVEMAGFKGRKDDNGMGVYEKHALVVVNYSAKQYSDLQNFTDKIVSEVNAKFGIQLEREPEVIEAN